MILGDPFDGRIIPFHHVEHLSTFVRILPDECDFVWNRHSVKAIIKDFSFILFYLFTHSAIFSHYDPGLVKVLVNIASRDLPPLRTDFPIPSMISHVMRMSSDIPPRRRRKLHIGLVRVSFATLRMMYFVFSVMF